MLRVRFVLVAAAVLALSLAAPGPVARADAEPLAVEIVVSPSTVSLDSSGIRVTVHAEIPYRLVDGLLVTLDGLPVVYTKSDLRGDLVAKFDLDTVKALLRPGMIELRLAGTTIDGLPFAGTDTIRVTVRQARQPASGPAGSLNRNAPRPARSSSHAPRRTAGSGGPCGGPHH